MEGAAPVGAAARRRDSGLRLLGDAFVARGALASFSVVSVFAVAHRVSVGTYGTYATVVAFVVIFTTFTDLGSSIAVVRDGVQHGNPRLVARTYVHVRLGLTVLACILAAALVPLAFPSHAWGAALLSVSTVALSGVALISPLGQLDGSMRAYRVGCLLQGGATLCATLAVVFVVKSPSAAELVMTNVFGALVGTVFASTVVRRQVGRLLVAVDTEVARSLLKAISLLGLASIVTTTYGKIDSVLVLKLAGGHAAGLYSGAGRLLDQAAILPVAVLVPISPFLAGRLKSSARLSAAEDSALRRIEVTASVGLSLLVIGLAHWAALGLMGPRFVDAGNLLCLLAVTQAWVVTAYVSTAKIVHAHRERPYIAVTVVGLAVNLTVNLLLIPRYGAYGAAYATVGTEVLTVLGYSFVGRSVSGDSRVRAVLAGLLVSSSAAALMLLAFRGGVLPTVGASCVYLAVAACCLLAAAREVRRSLPARVS